MREGGQRSAGKAPARKPSHGKRGLVIAALWVAIVPAALWLAGCAASLLIPTSTQDPGITVSPVSGSPIDHVVVIMQENRSFDNLFNGFPGADTVQSGESVGTTVPLAAVSLADPRDLDHTHPGWWQDWDSGKMDGFARAGSSSPNLAYSYVPEDEVEQYWNMARQYVLGDRMFQSNTGPSFPAHLYMIAGEAAQVTEDPNSLFWGCDAEPGTTVPVLGPNGTDLPGVFPCWDDATAGDLLDAKGISWRYYAPANSDGTNINSVYDAIRHIRYGSDWGESVIYPQTRVLTDIQNGELAQVTWVIPDFTHSDHPGSGSTEGPDWVASIVNAVGNSKFWNSTAIFIAWDDWGGWYDHVAPPQIDAMGPGFRVPVLVVSPYAKRGYISHQMHEASGFITFIEHNFGLGTLGTRDVESDDFADCFDYSQKPSTFAPIATRVTAQKLIHEAPSGPPDDD